MGKVNPYVYRIENTNGQYYIGVRWANKVPAAEDIMVKYTTSSKHINSLISAGTVFTVTDIVECSDKEEAMDLESLLRDEVFRNEMCLNRTNNKAIVNDWYSTRQYAEKLSALRKDNPKYSGENHPLYGTKRPQHVIDAMVRGNLGRKSERKGVTIEEEYGIEKADEIRDKMSKAKKGKPSRKKGIRQTKAQQANNVVNTNNPSKDPKVRNLRTKRFILNGVLYKGLPELKAGFAILGYSFDKYYYKQYKKGIEVPFELQEYKLINIRKRG